MKPTLKAAFAYHRHRGLVASKAIEHARADVAAGVTRYRLYAGWGAPSADGARWVENAPACGLRVAGYADEIARLRHTGWYTHDDQLPDETYRGVVLQLPGRGRKARYLAAYEDCANRGGEGYCVDMRRGVIEGDPTEGYALSGQYGAHRDAAHFADSFAEHAAEEAREYNRAWQAGARWRDLADEIADERRGLLAALAERRKVGAIEAPALCGLLRSKVRDVLARIEAMRAERAELQSESVWHADAWREGAGA